jgi:hypothetical protein
MTWVLSWSLQVFLFVRSDDHQDLPSSNITKLCL